MATNTPIHPLAKEIVAELRTAGLLREGPVKLDESKVAEVNTVHREVYLPRQGDSGCRCGWRRTIGDDDHEIHRARALCEAYEKGELNG